MRLSIVTICLNGAATLERTIASVTAEGSPPVEYVVVDGGSSDGTVEIVRHAAAAGRVTRWVSERDEGISDAFNKGIRLTTGDVVGMINADDRYLPGALRAVVDAYDGSAMDFVVYGNMIRERGGVRRRIRPRPLPSLWKYVDSPFDHPTVFVPRRVYDAVGTYRTAYRYAMDYDFFLRALAAGVSFRRLDVDVAAFAATGRSASDPRACHREVLRSQLENGLSPAICRATYALKMAVNRAKARVSTGPPTHGA
jgi:glycosyltransferase involved in cell wall biosynthesis